jgi:flagellar motor switch protein FliM
LEVRVGESEGQIQLAFPYNSLEPLVNKLTQLGATPATQAAAATPSGPKWSSNLDQVPLQMSAQWPVVKVTTRALLGLQVGSVLDLRAEDSERLELRVGKVVKFRGRLGTRENKWAIQITEVCKL